jgi:hydrogenase maturation protease
MTRALVLGVGNILMQDEGIGVHALEWLQAHYAAPEVDMIDGGTMGLDLLHYLEGIDHLLILDAIEAGKAPGESITLTGDAVPSFTGHGPTAGLHSP